MYCHLDFYIYPNDLDQIQVTEKYSTAMCKSNFSKSFPAFWVLFFICATNSLIMTEARKTHRNIWLKIMRLEFQNKYIPKLQIEMEYKSKKNWLDFLGEGNNYTHHYICATIAKRDHSDCHNCAP